MSWIVLTKYNKLKKNHILKNLGTPPETQLAVGRAARGGAWKAALHHLRGVRWHGRATEVDEQHLEHLVAGPPPPGHRGGMGQPLASSAAGPGASLPWLGMGPAPR